MSISLFGVELHAYGFIIAVAVWVTIWAIQKAGSYSHYPQVLLDKQIWVGCIGALIGARIWHVITDNYLYLNNPLAVFAVWNGGLSIIGGVAGVVLSILLYNHFFRDPQTATFAHFLDILALSIPFGQAIGRVGNYINQELYGLPSTLPWAIYIYPSHRHTLFMEYETYHPLFAYEALLTLFGGIALWLVFLRHLQPKIITSNQKKSVSLLSRGASLLSVGTGRYFLIYVMYYSVVRILLDFLRIDKTTLDIVYWELGINQVILIAVALLSFFILSFSIKHSKYNH